MPSYKSDSSYDSDFDDSRPSSPRLKRPRRSRWRRVYFQIRSFRYTILTFILFVLILRWYRNRRTPLFFKPVHKPSLRYKNVEWRMYAYSQFATNPHYLCNSVMAFDQLDRLGSKASRMLMYPDHWDLKIESSQDRASQLLVKARKDYGVALVPVKLEGLRTDAGADPNAPEADRMAADEAWDLSITKFLTFNQTNYLRILHFDSDVTVLKNMDDIFLSPESRIAMPRAYRHSKPNTLSSMFVLLTPAEKETERLMDLAEKKTKVEDTYDMEIMNELYQNNAMVLPHRKYGLLSEEFRSKDHLAYHGNDYEEWHPQRAYAEASLIHFKDDPLPKPWIMWPQQQLKDIQPKCDYMPGTPSESGCRDREMWLDLYHDFRKRRKDVCGLLSVPPPEYGVEREEGGKRVD